MQLPGEPQSSSVPVLPKPGKVIKGDHTAPRGPQRPQYICRNGHFACLHNLALRSLAFMPAVKSQKATAVFS